MATNYSNTMDVVGEELQRMKEQREEAFRYEIRERLKYLAAAQGQINSLEEQIRQTKESMDKNRAQLKALKFEAFQLEV